ncbi:FecR domain-containing protein, partial [Planktothrix sp. FACHB-1355]
MSHKLLLLLGLILWSIMTLPLPPEASAEMPLTKAVIQSLRNLVRLIPQNQTGRPARVSDPVNPGDSLATGRESLAELRFNDGSLARVGEQAVFQFLPNTRTFRLSNGTALLLIPPGRGTTRVQTPNARAGIRGSALFVRYNPETDTTVVGALTDSNIEVFNQNSSQ